MWRYVAPVFWRRLSGNSRPGMLARLRGRVAHLSRECEMDYMRDVQSLLQPFGECSHGGHHEPNLFTLAPGSSRGGRVLRQCGARLVLGAGQVSLVVFSLGVMCRHHCVGFGAGPWFGHCSSCVPQGSVSSAGAMMVFVVACSFARRCVGVDLLCLGPTAAACVTVWKAVAVCPTACGVRMLRHKRLSCAITPLCMGVVCCPWCSPPSVQRPWLAVPAQGLFGWSLLSPHISASQKTLRMLVLPRRGFSVRALSRPVLSEVALGI